MSRVCLGAILVAVAWERGEELGQLLDVRCFAILLCSPVPFLACMVIMLLVDTGEE